MDIFSELTYINKSSLALGFFDGLHLGHLVVLKNTIKIAKKNNSHSVVITFKEHPSEILTGIKVPQILTLDERLKILESVGIDSVVVLDFSEYISMKANDYLEKILIRYFSPIAITTGFNHSFGFNREGTSEFLHKKADIYKYKYFEVPPFVVNNNVVSCSEIRNKILLGDFVFANQLLGYNFFIRGIVQRGDEIARTLGFPSANISYYDDKIKVPFGVYFVKVRVRGNEYNGILNYGYAPTLSYEQKLKTEVHIIDFNQDIYGEEIKISFITKIREQQRFENKDKLISQLIRDKAFVDIYKYFLKKDVNNYCN